MTMMGLDIETIEHLDFDHAPPCEQDPLCPNAVAWKVSPSCCGRLILFCTPCKEGLVEGLKRSQWVEDTVCGARKTTILLIEPLDKS